MLRASGNTGLPVNTAFLISQGEKVTITPTQYSVICRAACRGVLLPCQRIAAPIGSATCGTAMYLQPQAKPANNPAASAGFDSPPLVAVRTASANPVNKSSPFST